MRLSRELLFLAALLLPIQACGGPPSEGGAAPGNAPPARPMPVLKVAPADASDVPRTALERFARRCRDLRPLEVGGKVLSPRKREAPAWALGTPETQKLSGRLLVLDAVIDAKGNICDAVLVKSLDPTVDAKLLEWARKLKYEPATLDGRPVACLFRITILLDL